MNLIKFILLICLLHTSGIVSAQCWRLNDVPSGYKINTVYELDSLIVSESFYSILDHSITLQDSIEMNYNETWIFYVIILDFRYVLDSNLIIETKLLQGVKHNIFVNWTQSAGQNFSGAFCYNGLTFFVLCNDTEMPIYRKLFTSTSHKTLFPVFYNNPSYINNWEDYGGPQYLEKSAMLYYSYYSGKFTYIKTHYFN